ncbi:MAG: winged helix-turn-helix transcriptional regulator [Erysipelotrichaceae bacterium]|nr:winged helix-turn-helix transcriptional regulator [Erysipelotrichaceae bacterium]MCI9313129.1 winged helix-turn-helix transcriptional regulator [Erysipelotrichaceae bacterium]
MNLGLENEYQEFKEGLGQLDKGLKSLTSMLNKHGHAIVYFGVDDDGNVCGLSIGKNTLLDIRNRIRDKIEPRIYADIQEFTDDAGKKYIKITASGLDTPYSFDGRYYLRNVSADEKASNDILRKLLATSDSDILRQKSSPIQELTFTSLFGTLAGNGIHPKPTKEFYSNYGLLNRDDKFNMNAYLLSDNNEISLKVVVFEGLDKSVMSKRTEYGSRCLLVAISEVMQYFETINITNVNLNGPLREEQSLFDFPSFREAWVNACLHNDWKNGIAPSIYMFDNRIEIVSYGGLPFSLSKEGFYHGTSVPVNKSLLTVFMAAKYAEQSGHGIPTIVEKYGRDIFSFDDGMLKVTIPLSFERPEVTVRRKGIMIHKNSLTENQKQIITLLSSDSSLTLKTVAEKTGISLIGVKKICSKLQELGILERVGAKRNGKWIIK